jgi:hypothetical protein
MSDPRRPGRSRWDAFWDNHIAAPMIKSVPAGLEEFPYLPDQPLPLRYKIAWCFAAPAMLAGIAAWTFDVLSMLRQSPAMGILGFLAALVTAILVFIGDLIASPGPKPSWFRYASILAVGSVLFVSFVAAMRR